MGAEGSRLDYCKRPADEEPLEVTITGPPAAPRGIGISDDEALWDQSNHSYLEPFQGTTLLAAIHRDPSVKLQLVVITDVGQDNDGEMAMILLSELHRSGEVDPLAVIANLTPAASRAALLRGTLDMLGLQHVPVGIGTNGHGGSSVNKETFSESITEAKTGVDYIQAPLQDVANVLAARGSSKAAGISKSSRIHEGKELIIDVLEKAEQHSVTLLLLSSLKDAMEVLSEREDLFVAKVKCITIMGGARVQQLSASNEVVLLPDETGHNHGSDESAEKFFEQIQELGIQLIILSRFAAHACPMMRSVYDLMIRTPVPNPVACRLHASQRASIEKLWKNVCTGDHLPPSCDKKWFRDAFCAGKGEDRNAGDTIWDLVQNFKMYDPLALLACFPAWRNCFFAPDKLQGLRGTTHLIIGGDAENSGMVEEQVQVLRDFLCTMWIRAAGRFSEDEKHGALHRRRPCALVSEQLTASLSPAPKRQDEELEAITLKVLSVLDHEWPQLKNSSFLDTWKDRDQIIGKIGPPMVLLNWETIENLGRIPHSEERRTITMAEAESIAKRAGKRFFIEMFSHRWNSPFTPDDRWNSKARALVEWAKYRWSTGLATFYWLDYCCINQNDVQPGVAMLPLYVSSCNNILCYDAPSYEGRAWCRVERLMFAAFVAPNNEFINRDFRFNEAAERVANNELKPKTEGRKVLPDPEQGKLSYPADVTIIRELRTLCAKHWGKCWRDGLLQIVEDKGGLRGVRELELGTTEVRLRTF